MRGPLFETWVVAELLKHRFNRGFAAKLRFWRDSNGVEVDVLAEKGARLRALEIKAGRTVAGDWFGPLERLQERSGASGALVYAGEHGQPRRDYPVFGWRDIEAVAKKLLG